MSSENPIPLKAVSLRQVEEARKQADEAKARYEKLHTWHALQKENDEAPGRPLREQIVKQMMEKFYELASSIREPGTQRSEGEYIRAGQAVLDRLDQHIGVTNKHLGFRMQREQ